MNPATAPIPILLMTAVESSQIAAVGHCPKTNTLAIQFKNWKGEPSSLYHYANFTAADFAEFNDAESYGNYFGKFIKPFDHKYPYMKIAKAVPSSQN